MSLVLFCVWHIAMPCAVLAVNFGAIGRGTARRDGATGGGMATAGLVCGLIALLIVPMVLMGCLATLGIAGLGFGIAA
jgi:hypothetical protein